MGKQEGPTAPQCHSSVDQKLHGEWMELLYLPVRKTVHSNSSYSSFQPPGNQETPSNSPGAAGGVHGCSPECLHLQGTHCVLHEDPVQRLAQR